MIWALIRLTQRRTEKVAEIEILLISTGNGGYLRPDQSADIPEPFRTRIRAHLAEARRSFSEYVQEIDRVLQMEESRLSQSSIFDGLTLL